jgi:hypothetical protein
MYKIEPHVIFPPLIVGIDALSIEIEYVQEHLIGEIIDRQVRQPLCQCVLTCVLTCVKSVGGHFE